MLRHLAISEGVVSELVHDIADSQSELDMQGFSSFLNSSLNLDELLKMSKILQSRLIAFVQAEKLTAHEFCQRFLPTCVLLKGSPDSANGIREKGKPPLAMRFFETSFSVDTSESPTDSGDAQSCEMSLEAQEFFSSPVTLEDFRFLLQASKFVMLNTSELRVVMEMLVDLSCHCTTPTTRNIGITGRKTSQDTLPAGTQGASKFTIDADKQNVGTPQLTAQHLLNYIGKGSFLPLDRVHKHRVDSSYPSTGLKQFATGESNSNVSNHGSQEARTGANRQQNRKPAASPSRPHSLPSPSTVSHLSYLLAQTERAIEVLAMQLTAAADAHDSVVEQFEALRGLCQNKLGVRAQRWGELPDDTRQHVQNGGVGRMPHPHANSAAAVALGSLSPPANQRPGTAPPAAHTRPCTASGNRASCVPSQHFHSQSLSSSEPGTSRTDGYHYHVVHEEEGGVSFIEASSPSNLYDSFQSPSHLPVRDAVGSGSTSSAADISGDIDGGLVTHHEVTTRSKSAMVDAQGGTSSSTHAQQMYGAPITQPSLAQDDSMSMDWQEESTVDFDTSAPTPQAGAARQRPVARSPVRLHSRTATSGGGYSSSCVAGEFQRHAGSAVLASSGLRSRAKFNPALPPLSESHASDTCSSTNSIRYLNSTAQSPATGAKRQVALAKPQPSRRQLGVNTRTHVHDENAEGVDDEAGVVVTYKVIDDAPFDSRAQKPSVEVS